MFSVSRLGLATLPQSRWSRPIATGAARAPEATKPLMAKPALARSPCPADACGEALHGDPLLGQPQPAVEGGIVGEKPQHLLVRALDILRFPRKGGPPKRPHPLAEEGADIGRQESWVGEGAVGGAHRCQPSPLRLVAQGVAIVKGDGAPGLQAQDGLHMEHRGGRRPAPKLIRVLAAQVSQFVDIPLRPIGEEVVGAGLVGDDVGNLIAAEQLLGHGGGVADQTDGEPRPLGHSVVFPGEGLIQAGGQAVAVPFVHFALNAGGQRLHHDDARSRHYPSQGLGAAHRPHPPGQYPAVGKVLSAVFLLG